MFAAQDTLGKAWNQSKFSIALTELADGAVKLKLWNMNGDVASSQQCAAGSEADDARASQQSEEDEGV